VAAAKAVAAVAEHIHSGKCLCGAVTYRAAGLADIWYCHCTQCRALSGHYLAACRTEKEKLEVSGEIVWAPHSGSSEHARCAACGSLLFWRNNSTRFVSVLPGSLEHAGGIAERGHIYVAEKGDYYAIADGLPQFDHWPNQGLQAQ
jgi:hypothetical protein